MKITRTRVTKSDIARNKFCEKKIEGTCDNLREMIVLYGDQQCLNRTLIRSKRKGNANQRFLTSW